MARSSGMTETSMSAIAMSSPVSLAWAMIAPLGLATTLLPKWFPAEPVKHAVL
jgi:hypothetical protein